MKDDVLPRQQRVLDLRQRLVQLALPISLRARVHPHAIYLAFRSIRWVIEVLTRVRALHNDLHHAPVLFPPLLALHLALLREYNFPRPAVSPNQGSNFGANCRCSSSTSPTNFMASRAGFSPQALNDSVAPNPCQPKQLYACCLHLLVSALALKSPTAKSQTYFDFQEATSPATAAATTTPHTETSQSLT